MANPTLNRPTRPYFDGSSGFGASTVCFVDFSNPSGAGLELKTGTIGRPYFGEQGHQSGRYPQYLATGFSATPDGGSPCSRWGYLDQGQVFPGCGPTGATTARTVFVTFRLDFVQMVDCISQSIMLVGWSRRESASTGGQLYILSAVGPVYTLGYMYDNRNLQITTMTLTRGHEYTLAFSFDDTPASGSRLRRAQAYDYTTQSLVTAYDVTNATNTISTPSAPNDFTVGSDGNNAAATHPWRGRIACAGIISKFFDTGTDFPALYADPWATVRGTFSAAGTFTAPPDGAFVNPETNPVFSFAAATGTGTGGTGTPSYYLQRYSDATTQPSTGARILGPQAPVMGGAAVNFTDTTAVGTGDEWYRLECVDGSDTVYYPAAASCAIPAVRYSGAIGVGGVVDSHVEGITNASFVFRLRDLTNRCHPYVNRGKTGTNAANWCDTVNSRMTISVTGSPTSGSFSLTNFAVGSGTRSSFPSILYNSTAAQLKTILESGNSVAAGIGGSGNATCSGGPLPGTPITVDFDGPVSAGGAIQIQGVGLPTFASNTMNGGGTPVYTPIWVGQPQGAYLAPAMNEISAMAVEEGINYWILWAGTVNDAAPSGFSLGYTVVDIGRYVASGMAYALTKPGIVGIVLFPPPLRMADRTGAYDTAAHNSKLAQVRATYRSICNGTTTIYGGDDTWRRAVAMPMGTADGIHFSPPGVLTEGTNWTKGLYQGMFPASRGVGGRLLLLGAGA